MIDVPQFAPEPIPVTPLSDEYARASQELTDFVLRSFGIPQELLDPAPDLPLPDHVV